MTHTSSHDTAAEPETSPQVEYVWQQIARLAEETFEAKKQADKERAAKEKELLRAKALIAAETARAELEAQRADDGLRIAAVGDGAVDLVHAAVGASEPVFAVLLFVVTA